MLSYSNETLTQKWLKTRVLSFLYNKFCKTNSLFEQVSIGLAVLCLPWLRWKHPEWQRPIKVNLIFPILYILATIYITIVPMIASPLETGKLKSNVVKINLMIKFMLISGIGCAIIFTGVPVYFIFVWWKNKPKFIQNALGKALAL